MSRSAAPHQESGPGGPKNRVVESGVRLTTVRNRSTRRRVARLSGSVLLGASIAAAAGAASASAAPAGRAYELVSPADHLAGAVPGLSTDLYAVPGRASDDGDRLLFGAGSTMGENWSGPANPMIFAHRTESGWQVRSAIRSVDEGNTVLGLGSHEAQSGWLTRDGREFVFSSVGLGNAPELGSTFFGVYRSPDALEPPEWLSRPNVGAPALGLKPQTITAGDDTRTVLFQSEAPLTADAPPAGTRGVYVRRDGELRLASIDPAGNPFTEVMNLANGALDLTAASAQSIAMRNHLAGNGRYVLLADGDANALERKLYVRDLDAGVTRQLAGAGTGQPPAVSLEKFWGPDDQVWIDDRTVSAGWVFGARNAPRAFFHSLEGPGQTSFVYDANLETGAVTPRPEIAGPPVGVSDDGEHMLFLEIPDDATGGTSTPGDWTLRYWSADSPNTSTPVATITNTASPQQNQALARVYRSSGDGKTWIFTAAGSPDPDRPSADPSTQQLYRWSVGDASPTCLSCESTDGVARPAGVSLTVQENIVSERFLTPTTPDVAASDNFAKTRLAQPGHSLSDDGRWLLFDSPDRLVGADTNDVRDVYLWDRDSGSDGELQLVTSGQGNTPSYALDLDPTGRNAFFTTREGLVPADDGGAYDVYVARIDGGFPDDTGESCVGEGCRPAVIPDPPRGPVGSPATGNAPAGPKSGVQQGTPKLRIRSVRTTSRQLTVRVDTPGAGRIRVSGKQVRTTNRTAKRSATYTLKVRLSTSARRQVAGGKTVKVGLQVRFTPSGSKKSTRVSSSVSVRKGR